MKLREQRTAAEGEPRQRRENREQRIQSLRGAKRRSNPGLEIASAPPRNDSTFRELADEINNLKHTHLYRECKTLEIIDSTHAKLGGREITLFCGNDYLGLSYHPKVIEAFQQTAAKAGVGSGASRLISGTSTYHAKLEERIARFKQKEKAILFSTGYLANLGAIQALCGQRDVLILDKLNHASLIDAARLSQAKVRVYPHRDMGYLEKILKQSEKFRRKLIVTDSVFSMDGDLAPLPEIISLKERYGAWLMVDEAHATGVFGKNGRGVAEHFGVEDKVEIAVGTLSKAIGTMGGFIAGSSELIDCLINRSRPFIFSTAMPASICAASMKSLELIETQPELRKTLWERVEQMKQTLVSLRGDISNGAKAIHHSKIVSSSHPPQAASRNDTGWPGTDSPIFPIVIGDEEKAVRLSEILLGEGILIPAVRYPTVAKGKARLRLTVSAVHTKNEIRHFISVLEKAISV